MYIYIYIYINVYVIDAYTCMHAYTYTYTYMNTYIYTYMHFADAYIHMRGLELVIGGHTHVNRLKLMLLAPKPVFHLRMES